MKILLAVDGSAFTKKMLAYLATHEQLLSGNAEFTVQRMENAAGQPVDVAPGSGHRVWINVPMEYTGSFLARYV